MDYRKIRRNAPSLIVQRNADGKLPDDELVEILTSSIEDTAGKCLFYLLPGRIRQSSKMVTLDRRLRPKQYTHLSQSYHYSRHAAVESMEYRILE